MNIQDKTKTKTFTSMAYDPDNIKRVHEIFKQFPRWAVKGIQEVLLIAPERASLYLSHNAQAEYTENAGSIWLLPPSAGSWSSLESLIGHEVGHHVFRKVLTGAEREVVRGVLVTDDEIKKHYKSHQQAEEEFANAFSLMYASGMNPRNQVRKLYPEVFRVLEGLEGRVDRLALRR
jgi:hypothetical protein